MSEKITYSVKGSSSEPYTVEVSLSPFTIVCNCQAAGVNMPCNHKIKIISGEDPGIVEGDKSKLTVIAQAAKDTNVFELLEKFDKARGNKKINDEKAEKAFKKYRDARIDLLQGNVKTDRAVKKAQAEMETAIESIVPAADERKEALQVLREIFISPYAVGLKN
ncbi:MAG: hypothetical protein LBB80_07945 [Treponema sp.]|jgi:hypothetical protein|nr:hypothetical protein [Treponema sp.]